MIFVPLIIYTSNLVGGSECVGGLREANGVGVGVVDSVVALQEGVAVDEVETAARVATDISNNEVDSTVYATDGGVELVGWSDDR